MDQTSCLAGQFLLAMPGLGDPRFERSVIAMCAHDHGGAFGICTHAELEGLCVPDLMRQLDIDPQATPPRPLLRGGPVETQRGFVLHSPDYRGQDTVHVSGRWALTGTRDVLEAIAAGAGPAQWLAALGYAGWDSGQLEAELAAGGWFPTPATTGLLWETPPADRWRAGFAAAGVDVRMISTRSGRA